MWLRKLLVIINSIIPPERVHQSVQKLREIGKDSDFSLIKEIQSGYYSQLSPKDLKFLLQDTQRACAAYPHITKDELTEGKWFHVSKEASLLVPGVKVAKEMRCLMPVVKEIYSLRSQ